MANINTDVLQSLGPSFLIGPVTFGNGLDQTGQSIFMNSASALATKFQAGNATAEITYTYPTAGPAGNNYLLASSTVGVLSWLNPSASYAPVGAAFVTIGNDATLTADRALTGTANQIVITDNGANSTVVLSTPQNINTAATPTFAGLTLTGPILLPDGTVSAPALAFAASGQTDNGIYRIGNDNWAMASSGAKVWEVANGGYINQALQPSFLVTDGTGAADVTGDTTAYTELWPTEIYDQGGNFATNTFTAPATGRYLLTANVFLRQLGASHTSIILSIVTSNREYRTTWLVTTLSFNSMPLHNSVIADMDINDTATVVVTVSGSTKTVDVDNDAKQNYFSGSLIN